MKKYGQMISRLKRFGIWLTACTLGVAFTSCAHPNIPKTGAAIARRADYLSEFGRLARIDWPNNRALTVVCLGHSVPAGYFDTPEVRSLDAYPNLLRVGLAEKYPHAVINVIVSAVGGENAERGARRFSRDVLVLRPDVLIIDYGLNDRGPGLEKSHRAWSKVVELALAHDCMVLLTTPTADSREDPFDLSAPLNQHARQIRDLAAAYQVGLADSMKEFQDYIRGGGNLSDLLSHRAHPNRKGHEIVANTLLEWFP